MNLLGQRAMLVREILASEFMADAVVLSGHAGLDRAVTRVRVAPGDRRHDGDFAEMLVLLDGRDLVVDNYLVDFTLRWMGDVGASFLVVVAPGQNIGAASRRLADRCEVVLATISGSILELADALHDLVENPERSLARVIVDTVERLGRITMQGGVNAIFAVLEDNLGGSARLIDAERAVVQGPPMDGELRIQDQVTVQISGRTEAAYRVVQPVVLASGERPSFWIVFDIVSPTEVLAEAARTVVKLASSYVATRLLTDRLEQERDARVRLGVLNQIVAMGERPDAALIQQVATLGWKTEKWTAAVHIRLVGAVDEQRILSFTPLLLRLLRDHGFSGPVIERSDGWTTWSVDENEPAASEYVDHTNAIRAVLRNFAGRGRWRVYAGIGRPYLGLVGLKKSLAEAQEAATIAQAGGTMVGVQHIDEVGLQRILVSWYTSDEFRDFALTLLRPVSIIDKDDELLHTLEVYLDHESSATVTSDILGLHRNTVINRIARARKVLAVDLDDPDQRLAVQLACRVVNLRE